MFYCFVVLHYLEACIASSMCSSPGRQGLICRLGSFGGGGSLVGRLAVCTWGDHQLAELQVADGLLRQLLLKGDARLHSEQSVKQSAISKQHSLLTDDVQ